jgi:hypothetical protein
MSVHEPSKAFNKIALELFLNLIAEKGAEQAVREFKLENISENDTEVLCICRTLLHSAERLDAVLRERIAEFDEDMSESADYTSN